VSSQLGAALDAQLPTVAWRTAILKAAQTWVNAANINIGVVADSGDPIGAAGPEQADPRFGDIRIAGVPMAGDALGEAIPPDPLLSGTSAGDIFFNTTSSYTANSLTSVALHEIGHALGLASSWDPKSVMSDTFTGAVSLATSDIAAIRALYGARDVDAVSKIRLTAAGLGQSRPMGVPTVYQGDTPLVAFGSLDASAMMQTYRFRALADYAGPITIQAQTAGVSLVPVQLTVFDAQRQLVGQVSTSGEQGTTATITIPAAQPGRLYYVRLSAAAGADAQIGRFGFAVTFDDQLQPSGISIADVLRGPYDTLSPNDLANLFADPNNVLFNQDAGSDDSPESATNLAAKRGPFGLWRYTALGSLSGESEADMYRVVAPQARPGTSIALLASVRAVGTDGVATKVAVVGPDDSLLPAQVLVNGNDQYTIQLSSATPRAAYFVRVFGPQTDQFGDNAGNYALNVQFRMTPVDFKTFATGTIAAGQPTQDTLYAGRTQLFGLALSATGDPRAAVRMTITNSAGAIVVDLTATGGETVSGTSTFLPPGRYIVTLTSVGTVLPVGYAIGGSVKNDPIGPQPDGTAYTPMYPDPNNPSGFLYPNGVATLDPFLWVLGMVQ
jgi:hypothetical protein